MSSYLNIPGSNVRITDGTIVMLARFPGTKWVTHMGWYIYNGRSNYGWYFCSVPAQTVIPANPQDLVGVVVVSDGDNTCPSSPNPAYPEPGTDHSPYPGPYPGDNFGPKPFPPFPPFPPYPPFPPAPPPWWPVFGPKEYAALNSAVITVETLRDRDKINTDVIPDGRIVIVNDVEGEIKYYRWNASGKKWEDFEFAPDYEGIEEQIEELDNRLTEVEETLQNPPELSELTGDNTILVSSDEGISDSLVAIGGQTIDAETADDKTVATEGAVVDLVNGKVDDLQSIIEEVTPKWVEF